MKKFFILAFLLVIPIFSARANLFEISEYKLENGLKLLVIPNHKAPIAKHMVWYKVGSVDEKSGKSGSAHLLEHLMFRGTKKVSGTDFNRIMQENGIVSNAFTSKDYTAYHQSLDISRLEVAMALEADRMQNLDFSDEDFITERRIVYQERKQVVDNDPTSAYNETLQRAAWQLHPYAKPVSGTEEEILSLTKEDIMDLYSRFYAPENATVVISGDIEPETALRLTKKYYGKVKARSIGKRKEFTKLHPHIKTEIEMQLPRVQTSSVTLWYVTDSFNQNPQNMYAFSVLAKYMGEGSSSYLYKDLVLKDKKALGVLASYTGTNRSYGSFMINAIPAEGEDVRKFKKYLKQSVKHSIENINEENIKIAKQQMLAGLVYLKDNPFDAAYIVGSLYTIGMDKKTIEEQVENLKKVTVDDVKRVAELLKEAPLVEGISEKIAEKQPQAQGGAEND